MNRLLEDHDSESPAVAAPGRIPLTYGGLRALVAEVAVWLARAGIGRGDRIALSLANGPEAATAFVALGSTATVAPLNPDYRAGELEFYLRDLRAGALVVGEGAPGPASEAAAALGIPVLRLVADRRGPAGRFALAGETGRAAVGSVLAEPGDMALFFIRPARRRGRSWCRSPMPNSRSRR
jgi:acyl-CoA synthetase (AMP-forming)/AMP-acid ligase II